MKVGGPPTLDRGQRLDQAYGAKSPPGRATAEEAAALLDPGRLLKGRVVAVEGNGWLTVATELGSFKASSFAALEVGREFWFQVVSAGANPVLAEAGKANAVVNLLRLLLPAMVAVDPAVASTADGSGPDATANRWQQLLADLALDGTPDPIRLIKALALVGQRRGQGSEGGLDPGRDSGPAAAANREPEPPASQRLGRLVEAHAEVNQQPAVGPGRDYLLFPVFFAGQAGRGEWLFSFDQGGGSDEASAASTVSLSFYLVMTRLGDLHLQLEASPQAIHGVFTLATAEAADHVRRHLPTLRQALQPMAATVALTCRSSRFDCLKAMKEELTARAGLKERFALLDVTA